MSLLVLRLLSRRGELKQKDGKDISRDMVPFDAVSDAYEQLTGEIKRFLKDPEWAAEGKKTALYVAELSSRPRCNMSLHMYVNATAPSHRRNRLGSARAMDCQRYAHMLSPDWSVQRQWRKRSRREGRCPTWSINAQCAGNP